MPPIPREVTAIDAQLVATVTRRAAARHAIRRRNDVIARAEADVLNYERQIAAADHEIDKLFDERARSQIQAQARELAAG